MDGKISRRRDLYNYDRNGVGNFQRDGDIARRYPHVDAAKPGPRNLRDTLDQFPVGNGGIYAKNWSEGTDQYLLSSSNRTRYKPSYQMFGLGSSRTSSKDYKDTNSLEKYENKHDEVEGTKRKKKYDSILGILESFAEVTSIQGVPYINQSNRWWSKCLWILIFLGGCGAGTYQLKGVFENYLSHPYTTKVELKFRQLDFPTVTICNLNAVQQDKLKYASQEFKDYVVSLRPPIQPTSQNPGQQGQGRPQTQGGANAGSAVKGSSNSGAQGQAGSNPGSGSMPTAGSQGKGTSSTALQSQGGPNTESPTQTNNKNPSQAGSSTAFPAHGGSNSGSPAQGGSNSGSPAQGGSNSGSATTYSGYMSHSASTVDPAPGSQDQKPGAGGASPPSRPGRRQKRQSGVGPGGGLGAGGHGPGDAVKRDPDRKPDMTSFVLGTSKSEMLTQHENTKTFFRNMTSSLRQLLGQDSKTFITQCTFNGYSCSHENFTLHQSAEYGNCYEFNGMDRATPFRAQFSGATYGLNLVIFLNVEKYVHELSPGQGIRVSVHPHGTLGFPEKNGLSFSPGQESYIALKMVNVTRLGAPYGDCAVDAEIQKWLPGLRYTQEACTFTCTHQYNLQYCGCIDPLYEGEYPGAVKATTRLCSSLDDFACLEQVSTDIEAGTITCQCQSACHEKSYEILTSSHTWPDQAFYYSLIRDVCAVDQTTCQSLLQSPDLVLKNFIHLKIFYRELNYQDITQVPSYDIESFGSDIGGTIGLWLGVSILSAAEVIQLVVEIFRYLFRKIRQQYRKTQKARSSDSAMVHSKRKLNSQGLNRY